MIKVYGKSLKHNTSIGIAPIVPIEKNQKSKLSSVYIQRLALMIKSTKITSKHFKWLEMQTQEKNKRLQVLVKKINTFFQTLLC